MQALDIAAAIDEREQAGGAACRDADRVGDPWRRQAAQLGCGRGGAEHRAGAGRMEAALPQFGMAGTRNGDGRLIAGDERLDQRRAARAHFIADREHRRDHGAARMHRPLPIAVVELDAVGGGAAEKGGVEEVGAPPAARHRNAPLAAHQGKRRLGAARHVAGGACDHHPDGIEQMPPRVMANLGIERPMGQPGHERGQRRGGAGTGAGGGAGRRYRRGKVHRLSRLGIDHREPPDRDRG